MNNEYDRKKDTDLEYCLKTILNTMPVGAMLVSKDGVVDFYNDQNFVLEGLKPSEVIGKKSIDVYSISNEESEHYQVNKSRIPILDRYQDYVLNDNRVSYVSSTYPIIRNGQLIATYSISRDVKKLTDLVKKTKKVEGNSFIDLLDINNNTRYTLESIVSKSEKMKKVVNRAKKFSKYTSNVLIYGETGVGKEIFAQGIHNNNPTSKSQKFVGVNCSAIPNNLLESIIFGTVKGAYTGAENSVGLIENAGFGTLFLDEINSMSIDLQSKLLRVIQERKYRKVGGIKELSLNCRIISSTNIPPERCLEENLIRKDLYYRLATNTLTIPPLRDRKDDIAPLVGHFKAMYAAKYGLFKINIPEETMTILHNYSYPGNVRELENIIESAITMTDDDQVVDIDCLPQYVLKEKTGKSQESGLNEYLKEMEKDRILEALKTEDWNVTQTAERLQISRQNLQYRIKKHRISKSKSHSNW